MAVLEFVVFFFVAVIYSEANKLPSYIKPCSLSDPDFEKCAIKHGQEAIPFIVKGDNKYKIPNMLPLKVPEIKFNTGGLHVKITNAEISGFEDAKILETTFDTNNRHISLAVTIDRVTLLGDYNIDGRILILPIRGEGRANITYIGGIFKYEFDYNLKEKNGDQYADPVNNHLQYNTTRSYYNLENLFGGDSALGRQTNRFLNENWKQLQEDLGPAVSETVNTIITSILVGIFGIVPINQIFS